MNQKDKIMNRDRVYCALDTERDYQDEKWKEFDDANNHPADWVIYMEKHLNNAKEALYNSHDMRSFRAEMRKVTALGVACLEQEGVENRT